MLSLAVPVAAAMVLSHDGLVRVETKKTKKKTRDGEVAEALTLQAPLEPPKKAPAEVPAEYFHCCFVSPEPLRCSLPTKRWQREKGTGAAEEVLCLATAEYLRWCCEES